MISRILLRKFSKSSTIPAKVLLENDSTMYKVKVEDRAEVGRNTFVLRCSFDKDKILGVPLGQHVSIHFDPPVLDRRRTYTPLNDLDAPGVLDVLVKVYKPCPQFPKGGALTQYLDAVKAGQELTISGPRGKYTYKGNGEISFDKLKIKRTFKTISFIAGGSGITPIYQILMNLRSNDKTKFSVLYANKTEADILMRKRLEKLQSTIPTLKISHTLETPPENWKGYIGYVSDNMIKENIAPPSEDHVVFICGPKEMNDYVKEKLINLGYEEDHIFFY